MHPHGPDAVHGPDRPGEFALERAGLVDRLLELRRRQPVAPIEDLVADRAPRGQAFPGEQQPRPRHLVDGHEDLIAAAAETVGDVLTAELIDDLGGVTHVEIAVEQRHLLGAAAA